MSKKKFSGSVSGKGYYIALVLCAVAIGLTGFLYYRNADKTPDALQDPAVTAGADNLDANNDVQAVAPQGGDSQNSQQTVSLPQKPANIAAPLTGDTIAEYSMDALSYNQTTRDWRVHNGVDIAAEEGAVVCAAADGTVYTGCNIENASYTPTVCAERTAFFKAITDGKKGFSAIAVCGGKDGVIEGFFPPCGVCRQVMREFCREDFVIHMAGANGQIKTRTLAQLLPDSFSL